MLIAVLLPVLGGLSLAPLRGFARSLYAQRMKWLYVALAAALLSGCGGSGGSAGPVSPFPTPRVRFLYATTVTANQVLLFDGTARGNAAPAQTLAGSNTQLDRPGGLTVTQNALYVANAGGAVTVYPAFTGGNILPLSFIRGNLTQLSGPSMIALDSAGTIYVTNNASRNGAGVDSIVAFAPGSAENVYPSTWIQGTSTHLAQPNGIAVDAHGDIFVANTASNTITAYAPVRTGIVPANETPFLTLAGGATGLNAPFGLAIDSLGRLWAGDSGNNTIEVFASNAFGNAAPMFTFSGAATGLSAPQEIGFDPFGQLDVANGGGSVEVFSPLPFPLPGGGNIAPALQISGQATQLTGVLGVAGL